MTANRERELSLVPPGYDLVAARTRLLAARLLAEMPAEPDHVAAERRAVMHDALAARHPRPSVPVPQPERHEGDEVTRDALRRLMPGRRAATPDPADDHAARLLAGVTKEPTP